MTVQEATIKRRRGEYQKKRLKEGESSARSNRKENETGRTIQAASVKRRAEHYQQQV